MLSCDEDAEWLTFRPAALFQFASLRSHQGPDALEKHHQPKGGPGIESVDM